MFKFEAKYLVFFTAYLSTHSGPNYNQILPSIEHLLQARTSSDKSHERIIKALKTEITPAITNMKTKAQRFVCKHRLADDHFNATKYPDLTQSFQNLLHLLHNTIGIEHTTLRLPIQPTQAFHSDYNSEYLPEYLTAYLNNFLELPYGSYSPLHKVFISAQINTCPQFLLSEKIILDSAIKNLQEEAFYIRGLREWKKYFEQSKQFCEPKHSFFYTPVLIEYTEQIVKLGEYLIPITPATNPQSAYVFRMPIMQDHDKNILAWKLLARRFTQILLWEPKLKKERYLIENMANLFWCFSWVAPFSKDNEKYATVILEALAQSHKFNLHIPHNLHKVALLCHNPEVFSHYFSLLWPHIKCETQCCH